MGIESRLNAYPVRMAAVAMVGTMQRYCGSLLLLWEALMGIESGLNTCLVTVTVVAMAGIIQRYHGRLLLVL